MCSCARVYSRSPIFREYCKCAPAQEFIRVHPRAFMGTTVTIMQNHGIRSTNPFLRHNFLLYHWRTGNHIVSRPVTFTLYLKTLSHPMIKTLIFCKAFEEKLLISYLQMKMFFTDTAPYYRWLNQTTCYVEVCNKHVIKVSQSSFSPECFNKWNVWNDSQSSCVLLTWC